MRVLDENRSKLLSEFEEMPLSRMSQDSASRDLPALIFKTAFPLVTAGLRTFLTDISQATVQMPSLFAISIGSSVMWQRHDLVLLAWIKRSGTEEGRKRFAGLKAKAFDPKTREARAARALKLLSEIKPIEGLDKAMWKSIVEETTLEDTYGD